MEKNKSKQKNDNNLTKSKKNKNSEEIKESVESVENTEEKIQNNEEIIAENLEEKTQNTSKKKKKGPYEAFFKRFFDILISLIAIIVLSPIMLIVYILSLIILKGNPLFKQYRPGKNNKIFKMYKFRSMTNKTDKNGNLLPDKDRITAYGKILRKLSLDELPQLFNILKGDMSIIGPRPRMVEECVFLNETQQARFKVRPGITGWAQVNGRNEITLDKVVQFDEEYVNNVSLFFDIKIFFKTIGYVFKRKGINKQGTVSNEFHGDYLLRTGQIEQVEYDEKISLAKQMISEAKSKK